MAKDTVCMFLPSTIALSSPAPFDSDALPLASSSSSGHSSSVFSTSSRESMKLLPMLPTMSTPQKKHSL
ncbi:hypothetical protein C4D60_Mb10t19240 [Musa balbisiana]|uniref:Uncharacterized protein n=1 Tax=Musa balbisiana TaxID=52838 RepID=A0A4S8IZ55_MUSBA|nr:hypothetical protein C4D60_Mb10t19240 [Musa balbisiana]